MKRILLIAFIFLLGFKSVQAQKNTIKTNPFGLIIGLVSVSYERVITEKSSIQATFGYQNLNISGGGSNSSKIKLSGLYLAGDYRLYFSSSKVAPRGWYAAPGINYSSFTGKDDKGEEGKISAVGFGAVAGHQWAFGKDSGFVLDLNLGFQYASSSTSGSVDNTNTISGILPKFAVAIGYAF